MYLYQWTRPGLEFAVTFVSRYLHKPGAKHLQAAKHTLWYVKGTPNLGIRYTWDLNRYDLNVLYSLSESDFAACKDTAKSTSGYLVLLNGGPVAYYSGRQATVALCTAIISATKKCFRKKKSFFRKNRYWGRLLRWPSWWSRSSICVCWCMICNAVRIGRPRSKALLCRYWEWFYAWDCEACDSWKFVFFRSVFSTIYFGPNFSAYVCCQKQERFWHDDKAVQLASVQGVSKLRVGLHWWRATVVASAPFAGKAVRCHRLRCRGGLRRG